MRAAAERHPGEAMAIALRLVGEAHRIEFIRIGPDIGHMMGEHRIDAQQRAGRDRIAHEGESRMARRGIEGTGGFSRMASLNAMSVSCMASRLSNVVGWSAAMPSPFTSSRNFACHCGWVASAATNDVSDEVSVSCAAIIRKLM